MRDGRISSFGFSSAGYSSGFYSSGFYSASRFGFYSSGFSSVGSALLPAFANFCILETSFYSSFFFSSSASLFGSPSHAACFMPIALVT
jgi:hypothetical protein